MKRLIMIVLLAVFAFAVLPAQSPESLPKTLIAPEVLRAIINEASGEMGLQNEILIAGVNRNRKAEECQKGYFETAFVRDRLKDYGIGDAPIGLLDVEKWVNIQAQLGLVEIKKK